MSIFSGIMVFVLIWWMVFFCMLPLQIETVSKPEDGTMPGAPLQPRLKRKAIWTTGVTVLVWLAIYGVVKSDLISFHDIAQSMPI